MSLTLERSSNNASPESTDLLQRLALDLTRACQASCTHCYNGSGPQGEHGEMTSGDWLSVIDQAAAAGVRHLQCIGGEPTLRTELPNLINRALEHGIRVEVFSNLIHVRPVLWPVLRQRGVSLATSYYSDQADEHEAITQAGPRRLWDQLDAIRHDWLSNGRLPAYGAAVEVDPDGTMRLRRGRWRTTIPAAEPETVAQRS